MFGIYAPYSDNNVLTCNKISSNDMYGIHLSYSDNNILIDNTVSSNNYGIFLDYSIDNTIYHNFINNTNQAYSLDSINTWDNGCEGNYWSNYNGTDLDGDGIGDEYLPWEGVDYYPLMSPYMEGDVNHDAIVNIVDIVIVAIAFGSTPIDPDWNPHADLNEDNLINIVDIVIVAIHFGETWD